MLKLVIYNELEKRIKRKPTMAECNAAYIDIIDNLSDTDTFADLNNIMADYIANNYTQCEQCGEYHLNDQMQTIDGPYGWQKVCNNPDCEQNAYYDVNEKRCREWATY